MTEPIDDSWTYVVTDIETDGSWPGINSMRSFASVAVTAEGTEHDRFEAVLAPLPSAAPHPETLAWFQTIPEAWRAATENPEPAQVVMDNYVAWLKTLPAPRVFAASPLSFDGAWIDYYLRRFTPYGLIPGPYDSDHVFDGPALCIRSYAAAALGRPAPGLKTTALPAAWFGEIAHTHRAIDDAAGYANLLATLIRMTRSNAAANPID